jgi:beta-glucosidase
MKKLNYLVPVFLIISGCKFVEKPVYKNPEASVEDRVEDLLQRMSLDEKVAQIQSLRIWDTAAWDKDGNFAGIKDTVRLNLGTGALSVWSLYRRSPRERVICINSFQKYMLEETRLGIPAFVFGEGLHGYMGNGATSFPQAIALGCTWDTVLIEKIFTVASHEAKLYGVTQVLSPVLDLARDPRWGRTEECYSEDPYLVSRIALASVNGWQGRSEIIDTNHVAVTLKHFAGHGQPEGGRNIAPVNYSEREFRESHLYPFEIAVKRGHAQSIMASYNEWDGVPNHINSKLLLDILRDEWNFDGFVMSDGGGLDVTWREHMAAKDSAQSGILSIIAGIDYDLGSSGCFAAMAEQVNDSLVTMEVLDRAVRNVLRVKFRCGLFDNPFANVDRMEQVVNCEEHRTLALEAAHKSMVLLKNDENLLPFDSLKIKTLAVIGPNAADVHLGGYSAVPMEGVSVLDGIKAFTGERIKVLYAEGCKITLNKEVNWRVDGNPILNSPEQDAKLIKEAVQVANRCDAVVLVIGENELVNREAWKETHLGDVDQLNLVGQQEQLARAILKTGKPLVVLLINGRPLSINYLAENAPAIIECWYLGQETGHAVADVLFGKVNPSGKLTVTFPRNVGQLPCYYNRKPSRFRSYVNSNSAPLFPFGHGLSYTNFEYSDLQFSSNEINPNDSVLVSVNVTNIGELDGDEIVQLYIHDLVSVPTRSIMELKDFSRINLKSGESKKVEFLVTPEKLEALNLKMEREVQPGDFAIMIGRNSTEYLSDTLRIIK